MPVYVLRSDIAADQTPHLSSDETITLRPMADGHGTLFQVFDAEEEARAVRQGDVYELLLEVDGPSQDVPSHAVYAIWRIKNPAQIEAFIDSRKQLFELRRRVLPHFTFDWLLRSLDQPDQFLVLGLYGDEESATRLCREHPEIQHFIRQHAQATLEAEDLTGMRCFVVEQYAT